MDGMLAFAFTIFVSAFLLFQVQPLLGRYILPWFGGTPAVWTTCLLFFQAALFAGYAYAHLLTTYLKPRSQVLVHGLLCCAALVWLPVVPSDLWQPTERTIPELRILALLFSTVGLPYLVLSATGPLLQSWFTQVNPGRSPFRLYALSNVGSLLALLSFPLFFETHFTRLIQARVWSAGMGLYVVGCGACALTLLKSSARLTASPPAAKRSGTLQVSSLDRFLWIALPACSSVLLLATTSKMCQEVAVVPFLWVMPLALYLLTFIICFDRPGWYQRLPFGIALVLATFAVVWVLSHGALISLYRQISVYSVALFVFCMVCHGELYRLKPGPALLTSFYLSIAGGGALGAALVVVAAPLLFPDFYEFQLGILACGALFAGICFQDKRFLHGAKFRPAFLLFLAAGLVSGAAAFWLQNSRASSDNAWQSRNFYGVLTVTDAHRDLPEFHHLRLLHGRITHGLQFQNPKLAATPALYYHEHSGVGLVFGAMTAGHRRIGLVGLGVGTLAAYARTGDSLHIYEINPDVIRLAWNRFTFLSQCPVPMEITGGDARLSLEREPPQRFDLLVLDAFNSDAIPIHLLTAEAFAIYQKHLAPEGILAVHISNRSLNLEPVVAGLARKYGCFYLTIDAPVPQDKPWLVDSVWMLLSRTNSILGLPLMQSASRPPMIDPARLPLWTDEFASLFQVLRPLHGAEIIPAYETEQDEASEALAKAGDFSGAIAVYQRALQRHPRDVALLNNAAFLLATCPDLAQRNPQQAVRYSEEACRLSHYHLALVVGTLGAAYSVAGRFEEAAAMAQKAAYLAGLSGEDSVKKASQELFRLYRAHQPYRADPAVESPK